MAEKINIDLFSEDNIVHEEVAGLKINPDGSWSAQEITDAEVVAKKYMALESSIKNLSILVAGKIDIKKLGNSLVAEKNNTQSFGPDGKIPSIQFECPNCHKKVTKLLKNGYCSAACANKARAERNRSKITQAGEKTIQIIQDIQGMLSLLDLALNILTMIPDTLSLSMKLPQEYRDFVMLRIETLFLKLRKIINNLEIRRNDKIIELMKKMKFGNLDDKLAKILMPVQTIISTVIALQQALNASMGAIIAVLSNFSMGGIPPNGGHGFIMSAKSMQYPMTAGKILVLNEPKCNVAYNMHCIINIIDAEKIDVIIRAALPPIQAVEYFLEPSLFKLRFALSYDNAPRVKKMIQLLETILVSCPGECFPRYKNVSPIRPYFVLAILTGWGPLTRGIFGDFIFHGAV